MIRSFENTLLSRLNENHPFIQVVMGPRQVGKTTGVKAVGARWDGECTYSSADSPAPPSTEWIREQWVTARSKGPRSLLVLDEIQKIAQWSEIVKILFDQERERKDPLAVVILGSASWNLQDGLTESLAGRFELLRVPHWSFNESREAFGWDLTTYLKFGGYPAPATLVGDPSRWQDLIRDSILEPMLSRDLLTLRSVSKPALLRQALELVLRHPAQELSLAKLLGQLQEGGNTTTIRSYLELLEAGFILKLLSKYTTRPLSTKSSIPKLLPLCGALIHAFEDPSRIDTDPAWRGRVFEAAIGACLVRAFPKLSYWREGNYEVDFIIDAGRDLFALEIKSDSNASSISINSPRRRSGLLEFKKHFPRAHTITLNWDSGTKLLEAEDPQTFLERLVGVG